MYREIFIDSCSIEFMPKLNYGVLTTRRKFDFLEYFSLFPCAPGLTASKDIMGKIKTTQQSDTFDKMLKDNIIGKGPTTGNTFFPKGMFTGNKDKKLLFYVFVNKHPPGYLHPEIYEPGKPTVNELLEFFIKIGSEWISRDNILSENNFYEQLFSDLKQFELIDEQRRKSKTYYKFKSRFILELVKYHNERHEVYFKYFLNRIGAPRNKKIKYEYNISYYEDEYPEFYNISLKKVKTEDVEVKICVNPALRFLKLILGDE